MVNTVLAILLTMTLVPAAAASGPQARPPAEPALTAPELKAVARGIATLHSPVDRSVANGWSNAKKVAEILCRPAALPALRKQITGVDRVFLGTDDPNTLTLESNQRLTGTGSARIPQGWQDFTFSCTINPTTGQAKTFEVELTPAK